MARKSEEVTWGCCFCFPLFLMFCLYVFLLFVRFFPDNFGVMFVFLDVALLKRDFVRN